VTIAKKGPKKKSAVPRDAKGRILPGACQNPSGRPKGSVNILSKLRDEIFKALEICESKGKPFSALLANWFLEAKPQTGATLTRAIAALMPKEVMVDGTINHLHSLTDEELDQLIKDKLGKVEDGKRGS
jgi:hypothetical protein